MKTYVLLITKKYPAYHWRKGEETYFPELIEAKIKKHTIRTNYELWRKRIKEVREGKAILSLRTWEGRPYHSKQIEVKQVKKEDKPGVQEIFIIKSKELGYEVSVDGIEQFGGYEREIIAKNDGLDIGDFANWFFPKKSDCEYTGALIHFTKFRYNLRKQLKFK